MTKAPPVAVADPPTEISPAMQRLDIQRLCEAVRSLSPEVKQAWQIHKIIQRQRFVIAEKRDHL